MSYLSSKPFSGGGGGIPGGNKNDIQTNGGGGLFYGDAGFQYISGLSGNQLLLDYTGLNASDEFIITNQGLGALGFLNYGAGDQEIHFDVTFNGNDYIAQHTNVAAIIEQNGDLEFWTGKGQVVGMPTDGNFANRFTIGDTGTITIEDLAGFGSGVVTVDLSGTLSWAAGAPATISIGDSVTGGTPYKNLFVDGSGNLGQDSILFDIAGNSIFDFTDLTTLLVWGDVSNAGHQTKLIMDDSTGSLTFMNSGSVFGLAVSEFDATADFGVLQSGHGLYVYGPTATTHIDSGGFMQFSVSNDTGIQQMGDLSAQYFSNIVKIDGPNRLITLEDSGSAYLSIDVNNNLYKFGDIAGANHSTREIIDDVNQIISLQAHVETLITDSTGRDMFRVLPASLEIQMGDLGAFGNSTNFTIDDGGKTFTYSVGTTARPIFANGDGDVSLGAWGTALGDSIGLGIQQGSNVVYLGKYDGVSLGANLSVDGGAKTINILGGLTLNGEYATPTTGATLTINDDRNTLTINPAGTIAALTVVFPTAYDGRIVMFDTTQKITTLTLSGGTFANALPSMNAGDAAIWKYSAGDSKWHLQALFSNNISSVVSRADLTGRTTATNLCALTPATKGQYSIGGYVTITAVSLDTLQLQVTYTDETSTSRTQTFFPQGLTSANLSSTGAFVFPTLDIFAKSGSPITVSVGLVVGTGSVTFDTGASITKI